MKRKDLTGKRNVGGEKGGRESVRAGKRREGEEKEKTMIWKVVEKQETNKEERLD